MLQFPDDLLLALAYQDALLRENRHADAEAIFTKRKDANPKDPFALLLLGRLRGGAEGRTLLQAALKAMPACPEGVQALAELEEADGQLDAAKAATEMLLGLRGSARDWTYAGYIREQAGDHAAALDAYTKATALEPGLVAPKIDRALLLAGDGKAADGLAVLESDPAPPTRSAVWQIALALARNQAGQPDRAKTALDQAIEFAAGDRRLLYFIVGAGITNKMTASARVAVEGALAKFPNDPDFLAAKGVLALEAKSYAEARDWLDQAGSLAPKDARLMYLLGIAELRLTHVDKALAAFKAAFAADPKSARYALAIAHVLDRKGAKDKDLLAAWKRAWELDPKDPEPHIDAALWLNAKGKFDDATDHMEIAVGLDPKDPDLRYILAILHGDRQGFYGKALDDLREYKKLGGKDEKALAWLQAMEDENNK